MFIYLIGHKKPILHKIYKRLIKDGFDCQVLKIKEFKKKASGIYLLLPGPDYSRTATTISELMKLGNPIISLCRHKTLQKIENEYFLDLSQAMDPLFMSVIVRWLDAIVKESEKEKKNLQKQTLNLKNALRELDYRNRRMIEELSLASELQKSFLPKKFPEDIPINFTHKYIPYEYIGGDFFEIIRLGKYRIGIVIADVSGHGVAAALITAMFKSTFHHFAPGCLNPAETLNKINLEFLETIHTEHYITAFYAIIDIEKMSCSYCSAGHFDQFIIRKNGDIESLKTQGFFIGMFEGTEYEKKMTKLYPGDRLIFYTDGIVECTDEKGKGFGKQGLLRVIKQYNNLDITSISNSLISELMNYMAEFKFPDDITLLIVEIMENI